MHNVAVHGAVAWDEGRSAPWAEREPWGRTFGASAQSWQDHALIHSPCARRWQDARELRPPTSDGGDISPWCVHGRPSVAIFSRDAFSGALPWREIAPMHSRTPFRGNFLASCILERAPDGKSAPPWQHITAMHPKRADFGKICAPCIRKAPQTAFRECIARRSCQGGALFAALTPRITHGARILPSRRWHQTARAPAAPVPAPSARPLALKRCSARKREAC